MRNRRNVCLWWLHIDSVEHTATLMAGMLWCRLNRIGGAGLEGRQRLAASPCQLLSFIAFILTLSISTVS